MFNPYEFGDGVVKLLVYVALIAVVLALATGMFVGGSELLNPREAQARFEQVALENERARADFAYQEKVRATELEKQRQLARIEVEEYPELLRRREEKIDAVVIVVGGAIGGAVLALSGALVYFLWKRASQSESGDQRISLPRSGLQSSRTAAAEGRERAMRRNGKASAINRRTVPYK